MRNKNTAAFWAFWATHFNLILVRGWGIGNVTMEAIWIEVPPSTVESERILSNKGYMSAVSATRTRTRSSDRSLALSLALCSKLYHAEMVAVLHVHFHFTRITWFLFSMYTRQPQNWSRKYPYQYPGAVEEEGAQGARVSLSVQTWVVNLEP